MTKKPDLWAVLADLDLSHEQFAQRGDSSLMGDAAEVIRDLLDRLDTVREVLSHPYPDVSMTCWTSDQEAAVVVASAGLRKAFKYDLRRAMDGDSS